MLAFTPPSFICVKWPQQGEWAGATGSDRLHRSCSRRDLVNRCQLIDERAREVMVDVIERVARALPCLGKRPVRSEGSIGFSESFVSWNLIARSRKSVGAATAWLVWCGRAAKKPRIAWSKENPDVFRHLHQMMRLPDVVSARLRFRKQMGSKTLHLVDVGLIFSPHHPPAPEGGFFVNLRSKRDHW